MAELIPILDQQDQTIGIYVFGSFSFNNDRVKFYEMVDKIAESAMCVIVDMTEYVTTDFSELACLLRAQETLARKGKVLVVVNGEFLTVCQRIATTDVIERLRIVESVKEAIDFMEYLVPFVEALKFTRTFSVSCHRGTEQCPLHSECHKNGGEGRVKDLAMCHMKLAPYYFDEKMKGGVPGPP